METFYIGDEDIASSKEGKLPSGGEIMYILFVFACLIVALALLVFMWWTVV